MKKNRAAFIIVAVLAILSIWVYFHNKPATFSSEGRNFAIEDTSEISKIILADLNKNRIELVKVKPGDWTLNEHFKARNDAVNLLLSTMKNVKVKNRVGKNALNGIIGAMAAKSVKVEVFNGSKCIKAYYVGSPTQDNLGTHMLLSDPVTGQNAKEPFATYIPGFDGFLTPRFFTSEIEWRTRVVYNLIPPEIKSIEVSFPEKGEAGFLIKHPEKRKFELVDLKENRSLAHLDTLSVMQYMSYFQNIQYELEEDLPSRVTDSILKSTPFCKINVTEADGKSNFIKFYYKMGNETSVDANGKPSKYDMDRLFAEQNGDKHLITMQYFVIGKLVQPVSYFLPKSLVKK